MTSEKFILESKAIWGNILAILAGLGTLGYIKFSQTEADIWTIIIAAFLNLATNLYSMYGRYKADKRLTSKLTTEKL